MVKQDKPLLRKLFARIKKLTSKRGDKSALAEEIGITMVSLSSWAAGRYEPGGEITLRLLKWAEAREAKTKDAGAVAPAPARKARTKSNTSNERKDPGRRAK